MNEKTKFIIKVTVAHFVTYLICGLIFANIFNYEALFELGNVKFFMKDAYGTSSLIGPFVQILRGAIIGCILLILKDNVMRKKNSWFISLDNICRIRYYMYTWSSTCIY